MKKVMETHGAILLCASTVTKGFKVKMSADLIREEEFRWDNNKIDRNTGNFLKNQGCPLLFIGQ